MVNLLYLQNFDAFQFEFVDYVALLGGPIDFRGIRWLFEHLENVSLLEFAFVIAGVTVRSIFGMM